MWRRKSPSVKTPATRPCLFTTLIVPDFALVMAQQRVLDAAVVGDDGVAVACAHDVLDLEEHRAADGTGGMQPRIIGFLETARFEDAHGESVAERQHGGRARRGHEVERAGFLLHVHAQDDVAMAGETGFGVGRHGNDGDVEALDRRAECGNSSVSPE